MTKEYVEEKEGAYRVGGTRVLLDSVVYCFRRGASSESIQRSFPALTLEQVYGAIAYYLGHKDEIDRYLIEGEREFEKLQQASRQAYPDWYEKIERARKGIVDPAVEKTCFQSDVNLNENIVNGVLRRVPEFKFETAREAGLYCLTISEVLHLANSNGRILVTQDHRAMTKSFEEFMALRPSLGVLIISQKSNIEPAIKELILIWNALESYNHVEKILYLDF